MVEFLGSSLGVFFGVTVVLMGFCAFMTGQALASSWKPFWHLYPYMALMGLGDRFLHYALFQQPLVHLSGYIVGVLVLFLIAAFAYRVTHATKVVMQYPWAYERTSLFGYREK